MVIASAVHGILPAAVLYSDWIGLGVAIQFPDSDQPEVCLPMLKASELQIVENWDTFGLRGSGSNQVIAENVYVPMERILRLTAADTTGRPPEADYDQDYPLYHVPFYPAFYLGFPNMALGGAERLIEEFKKATEKSVRLMDGMRESESPRSQRVMAEITTQFHTAEALMDKYLTLLENYERDGRQNKSCRILCDSYSNHKNMYRYCGKNSLNSRWRCPL